MGRSLFAAIIASIAAVSTPAAAGNFVTGNDLLRYCQDSQAGLFKTCVGYVLGVVDTLEDQRADNHVRECVPKGVEAGQIVDVVVKFLHDYPQIRQDLASELVGAAVIQAWNCGHP
jgi:hypothetical protein